MDSLGYRLRDLVRYVALTMLEYLRTPMGRIHLALIALLIAISLFTL